MSTKTIVAGVYGIGFGSVTPNIPAGQTVRFKYRLDKLQPYFGLAPGAVAFYQFNVIVPNAAESDPVPLTFTLAGTRGSQVLYIAVQN